MPTSSDDPLPLTGWAYRDDASRPVNPWELADALAGSEADLDPRRVLVMATYPIANPQQGGQKRLEAVVEVYRRCFESVRFAAVFNKNSMPDHGPDDISLGAGLAHLSDHNPLTSDILCGDAVADDVEIRERVTALLLEYRPDVLHLEQPFLYLGLEGLLADLDLDPILVFGSQNVEAPMKREILEGAGVDPISVQTVVDRIDDVEHRLARRCRLLAACTAADVEAHKAMGADRVVLAENGIAAAHTTPDELARWRRRLDEWAVARPLLFVASAHPPSITGFLARVGKSLGFLPPHAEILVAGSVSDYFQATISRDALDLADATFWERARACGRLREEELGALLRLADVLLLPITEGGGSNLKTAEAILADRKVVATTHALRSFEWFRDFPNVWVADTRAGFREAMLAALDADLEPRTPQQHDLARTVLWHARLAAFEQAVRDL